MPRIAIMIVFSSTVRAGVAAQPSNILEKSFAFPPPVQWISGNWEVSLIGVAWGPANSPEMISKGHGELFQAKRNFSPTVPTRLRSTSRLMRRTLRRL